MKTLLLLLTCFCASAQFPEEMLLLSIARNSGPTVHSPAWFNSSYTRRQSITFTNPNATALTEWQVSAVVPFDADMQVTFADLIFTDSTGTNRLHHWHENVTNSTGVRTWVNVPAIGANSITNVWLYYGNAGASSAANGHRVFEMFDDFSGASLYGNGPTNAATPLTIPTYDGTGQAVHPSVVDFITNWNGFRYWMAMTPYSNSMAALENPSILRSSNGVDWVVPDGMTNPITPFRSDHHDDPDLFYDLASDQLWCFYNWNDGTNNHWFRLKRSSNGTNWSDELSAGIFTNDYKFVSPSLTKKDSTYYLYSVMTVGGWSTPGTIQLRTSATGTNGWSIPTSCTLAPTTQNKDQYPWHLTARWIPNANEWWTIYNSDDSSGSLYLCRSTDGTAWNRQYLMGATTNWDRGLYRASFTGDTNSLRIWYTGVIDSTADTWKLGYTEYSGGWVTNIVVPGWRQELGDWTLSTGAAQGTRASAALSKLSSTRRWSNAVAHVKFKLNTSGYAFFNYFYKEDANRYFISVRDADAVLRLSVGSSTTLSNAPTDFDAAAWYQLQAKWNKGDHQVFLNDVLKIASTDASTVSDGYIQLQGWQGAILYDDFFLRKYSASEVSTLSFGSEERYR